MAVDDSISARRTTSPRVIITPLPAVLGLAFSRLLHSSTGPPTRRTCTRGLGPWLSLCGDSGLSGLGIDEQGSPTTGERLAGSDYLQPKSREDR